MGSGAAVTRHGRGLRTRRHSRCSRHAGRKGKTDTRTLPQLGWTELGARDGRTREETEDQQNGAEGPLAWDGRVLTGGLGHERGQRSR